MSFTIWSELSGGYFWFPITKPNTRSLEKDLLLIYSLPIVFNFSYLWKGRKKVGWKTIGRLEDELNKFLSWWHPFQVSGGLWLRFRWNWPQPRGSRRPARARPERAAWCEEPDGDLSIRYTYIYNIYIYSKMKRWRNTVAAFTNHHSFQPNPHGPNNAFWPLPATPVILAAVVASGSCDGAWIALAWPSSCASPRPMSF